MTDPAPVGPGASGFAERGYCIVPAGDPAALDDLRRSVRDVCHRLLGVPTGDVGDDLDHLHRHLPDPSAAARLRTDVTREIGESLGGGRSVFRAFEHQLRPLVGNDVLSQRIPNVVLQPPGDPYPTVLHRDAPANSPYEVVAWVPLVDCFRTKSMYLLDHRSSTDVLDFHHRHPDDADGFRALLDERAEFVSVPYGHALLFWSGLFHGSVVNAEPTTRISLNTRFKHLFAPLGMKDPFRYFEVLETTALTQLGLHFQRTEG